MLPIASATGLLIMPAPKSAGQTAAENLHTLGLLAGVGNTADGSVNFDVNGSLTRAQSVVQIVRFLGAEKTAKTQTNANPFTDLAVWAVPYVSYAYANSITSGRSATIFDPDTAMNDAGFLTLLLRVLGYADKNDGSGDFVWNNPYTLAKQVGLIDSTAPDTSFTRGDAFVICYRALTATVKSGDKLCDRLVKIGAVDAKTMASVLHLQLFDGLTVGSAPITEARIIVSKDASVTEQQLAKNLVEDIRKAYGKTLLLTTDATNKVGAEIVIGKTAREISKKVPDLTKLEAAMLVSDDSIVLMAATNAKMHSLTDWFSENYITGRPTVDLTEADTTIGELLCNPIRSPQNSGDPCIEYDPETGYYYAIYSSPKNDRATLYRSKTLSGLGTAEGKELYVAGDEQVIKYKLFAPEIVKVDGKWYIYASGAISWADLNKTVSTYTRLFCLEAVGEDPYGDYEFKAVMDEYIWAIDAHVFSWEGENYIAFARCTGKNHIAIARLKNPWTIDATRVTIIASPELEFELLEPAINEGPHTFVSPDGRLFLLYAANSVSGDHYCLGLLEFTGDDILAKSSWTKTDHAVLKGANGIKSPGHCSVFMSPDGTEYWLAYHYQGGDGRILAVQPITFDENGDPVFGEPYPTDKYFFAPSGE